MRERRESLGYSQDYVALKMGMSQPNYSNLELGKTRLTPALVAKANEVEGFADFEKGTPAPTLNSADK